MANNFLVRIEYVRQRRCCLPLYKTALERPPIPTTDTCPTNSSLAMDRALRLDQSRAKQASHVQTQRSSYGDRQRPEATIDKAKQGWTVPHEIRNKCVRLGWAPNAVDGEHQNVFGCLMKPVAFVAELAWNHLLLNR